MELELYRCGSSVIIKLINIQGFITGICIRDNRITYEVSYFLNNQHCIHWFSDYELDFEPKPKKQTIGFIKASG